MAEAGPVAPFSLDQGILSSHKAEDWQLGIFGPKPMAEPEAGLEYCPVGLAGVVEAAEGVSQVVPDLGGIGAYPGQVLVIGPVADFLQDLRPGPGVSANSQTIG